MHAGIEFAEKYEIKVAASFLPGLCGEPRIITINDVVEYAHVFSHIISSILLSIYTECYFVFNPKY